MLLDHVVLFVDNLEDAVDTFTQQGFTVTPGGVNGPTHNALIAFANETYIELIALQSRKKRILLRLLRHLGLLTLLSLKKRDLNGRLLRWFSGTQGFADICLRVVSLEAFASAPPRDTGCLNHRYCIHTTTSGWHSCFVAIGRRCRLDAAVFY